MAPDCNEVRDSDGQRICGQHGEPLVEKRIPSQTQNRPMIVLFCPISGKQIRVIQ